MNEKITIYIPNSRLSTSAFQTWLIMFGNVLNCRELIFQLFKRDFLAAYKKSFLGIGWIFISPFFGIAAWVLTNQTGILKPGTTDVPYPAYVLMGTFFWAMFLGYYSSSATTLTIGAGFIHQVKYPHEVLFAKQILQQSVSSSITLCINLFALSIFGVFPTWKIVFLPILILPILLFASGLGLMVSVIGVVMQEVQRVFELGWNFIFWLTPIVYTTNISNETLKSIIKYNPLTYMIGDVRDFVFFGKLSNINEFLICFLLSLVFFLAALRLFYLSEQRVIEKML